MYVMVVSGACFIGATIFPPILGSIGLSAAGPVAGGAITAMVVPTP